MVHYELSQEKAARIDSIQFGIIRHEELVAMSVVNVNNINIYHRGEMAV